MLGVLTSTPWRSGSASDSGSEGCVFESRRGHGFHFSFAIILVTICIKKTKRRTVQL